MEICGIICEYNPLHLGHKKQLSAVRKQLPNGGIVCLMSGNFVQRGHPAVIDKSLRAKAAILSGADLVLELPVTASLSSAEGFASEGVRILSGFCSHISFGSETGTLQTLMATAEKLLDPSFNEALRKELDKGLSFPAARQAALGDDLLTRPNDILAIEYCKAILSQGSAMTPLVIRREGSYHDERPDAENPSATALRSMIDGTKDWLNFVPEEARDIFRAPIFHKLPYGERAILAKLRSMTELEFEALPYGSEGLWRKLMHAVRKCATLEDIITEVKSKRYTRTRLDRMIMCAYLGITREMQQTPAPYTRVLAFNDKGREILKQARESGEFLNAGEQSDSSYQLFENRCEDLYGLFADKLQPAGLEKARRVEYLK